MTPRFFAKTDVDVTDKNRNVASRKTIESFITKNAINRALSFRTSEKLALISGAGISGLAASFVLRANGFNVCIAEKRHDFNRFNVINLDAETQRFLKKFDLIDEFEKDVAGRLEKHEYVLVEENGMKRLDVSDVSKLQHGSRDLEPEMFNELFKEDGIYSVKIKDLQNFLAKKALEAGVCIFSDTEITSFTPTEAGGVSTVTLTGVGDIKPDFLFVAEGARSTTANLFGMGTKEVKNECTGENWIYGNVEYSGENSFVVALIDTSGERLEIANVIFNAKIGEINIAVTAKRSISKEDMHERLLATVNRACSFLGIAEPTQSLIATVKNPVHIKNVQRTRYSTDNVFCIGDTAGHSSPLAGVGGTLGMTLAPRTVEQLIDDSLHQPQSMHDNFHRFTEGYTSRWIEKSQGIKMHCLKLFKAKEQATNNHTQETGEPSAAPLKNKGAK